MWLKKKNDSPTFNYSVISNKNKIFLKDEVKYFKKGKHKSIVGYDYQNTNFKNEFIWQGTGILKCLKNKWKIIYYDLEEEVAVIYFEKTWFISGGYDVISRNKKLNPKSEAAVFEFIKSLDITKELVKIDQR